MEKYYELRSADIGRSRIRAFGRYWPTEEFIGRVMPCDVGKRVYQRVDIVQVENDEQRNARLGRLTTHNVYAECLALGVEMDHHESDLYVLATPETVKLARGTCLAWSEFRSELDGRLWIEFPFAYEPFWTLRESKAVPR